MPNGQAMSRAFLRRFHRVVSQPSLAIDVFTVADLRDDDNSVVIIDGIHDAIITLPYAVLVFAFEFFASAWTRIPCQCIDPSHDSLAIFLGSKRLKLLCGGLFDQKLIAFHAA